MCMAIKEEKKNWENTKPSYHTPNPTNELGTQRGLYNYKVFTFEAFLHIYHCQFL